jgi:hypothetical protein
MSNTQELLLIRSYLDQNPIPWKTIHQIASSRGSTLVCDLFEEEFSHVIGEDLVNLMKESDVLYDLDFNFLIQCSEFENGLKFLHWLNLIAKSKREGHFIKNFYFEEDVKGSTEFHLLVSIQNPETTARITFRGDVSKRFDFSNCKIFIDLHDKSTPFIINMGPFEEILEACPFKTAKDFARSVTDPTMRFRELRELANADRFLSQHRELQREALASVGMEHLMDQSEAEIIAALFQEIGSIISESDVRAISNALGHPSPNEDRDES